MEIINVLTGEVKIGVQGSTLIANAIGSCIVVSAFDPDNKIGIMAHIMLPGTAPEKPNINKLKYARNAIDTLLTLLSDQNKTSTSKLSFCLVGGGNVLQRKDDSICRDNIESVRGILNEYGLAIAAQTLGGIQRRTSKLLISSGKFYYTEGGSNDILLFDAEK